MKETLGDAIISNINIYIDDFNICQLDNWIIESNN